MKRFKIRKKHTYPLAGLLCGKVWKSHRFLSCRVSKRQKVLQNTQETPNGIAEWENDVPKSQSALWLSVSSLFGALFGRFETPWEKSHGVSKGPDFAEV